MAKKKTVVRKKTAGKSKAPAVKKKPTRSPASSVKRRLSQMKQVMAKTGDEALARANGEVMAESSEKMQKGNANMIEGDVTIYHAAGLKEKFLALVNSANGDVEIDLSQVSEIDTAGFQLMVMVQRECKKKGKSLRFTNPSDAVKDLFKTYRANTMFGA